MIDIIGDIVGFFIRSFIGKLIAYIMVLGVLIGSLMEWAYFKATGRVSFDIFFNPDVLSYLTEYYKREIGLIGIFTTLFFMGLYFYQERLLRSRANCAVQEVELAEIAKIWLEAEEYKKAIKEEIEKELPKENKKEVSIVVPAFHKEESKELFKYIEKNKEAFSNEGINIIIELLTMLESTDTPSVVSNFKQDPNVKEYKNMVIAGKTSYDILEEIDLYTHSLNVAKKAVEYLKTNNKDEMELYLERAIVAALAHDIGKIKKALPSSLPVDVFKNAPHNAISAMILREKHPEYHIDVIEAVEQHHGGVKNKNNYILNILLWADRKAREEEIKEWLIKHKKEKEAKEFEKKYEEEIKDEPEEKELNEKPQEETTEIENPAEEEATEVTEERIENEEEIGENDLDIDFEDIFGEDPLSEEVDITWAEEQIKEYVKEHYCDVNLNRHGIDFNSFSVVFNNKAYLSLSLIENIIGSEYMESFKEHFRVKPVKVEVKGKEYEILAGIFDYEEIEGNCKEVVIKEEE